MSYLCAKFQPSLNIFTLHIDHFPSSPNFERGVSNQISPLETTKTVISSKNVEYFSPLPCLICTDLCLWSPLSLLSLLKTVFPLTYKCLPLLRGHELVHKRTSLAVSTVFTVNCLSSFVPMSSFSTCALSCLSSYVPVSSSSPWAWTCPLTIFVCSPL